jgi:hypothetical protein
MKRVLGPLIVHAILCVLTWLGFEQGESGAANVVIFAVWLALVPIGVLAAGGVLVEGAATKAAAKPKFPGWAAFVTRAARWFCLVTLVWHGAWATSIGFAVFMLGIAIANKAIEDAREKLAADALAQAVAEGA